ncbi:MAG: oxidoreductase [Candidatus Lokiarchaeota archaeon]|nr:oxidoreductase [Candidatus Lokiarchaeota archaeon]
MLATPGKQPTREQQLQILPECDAYLAGIEPIDEEILEGSTKLRIISRNGVGIDNIDLKAAQRLGIPVIIASGANSQGVAELSIGLIFSAIRSIPLSNNRMKNGLWEREKGMELFGKTLGVIGAGNIGKKVIKMALGVGMNVLGYDLFPDVDFNPSDKFSYSEFDELLINSDIITLHCPPSDTPLINERALEKTKEGVIIINTARAGVVDEGAILDGLNSRMIKVYATDVYDKEPPEMNDLIEHKYTITTPHIGGYTEESIDRAAEVAVNNIIDFFRER